jgi:hypothetical protein
LTAKVRTPRQGRSVHLMTGLGTGVVIAVPDLDLDLAVGLTDLIGGQRRGGWPVEHGAGGQVELGAVAPGSHGIREPRSVA